MSRNLILIVALQMNGGEKAWTIDMVHLLDKGVRVTGTDGWSWDAPFVHTAKRFRQSGDASLIWEGHKAGQVQAYCHLEKLANLESLPSSGFDIICFPVKVAAGSAGWARAVAVLRS